MVIDYSGTAGQVRIAFRTEIHNLMVNGVSHVANMTDPQIPAALAPAVVGIVSLHNFKPHPMAVKRPVPASTEFTQGGSYWVTPPDLATIYNFNPVFNAGNTGQNQSIYLIEDTDLYTNSDWTTFRAGFGLSGYSGGSLNTVQPGGCTDLGVNSDDGEAILDAEYASAGAPSAAIVIATCAGSNSTFGQLIAIQNLVNGANPPDIVSISYGECEAISGATLNAAFYTAYQTGVAGGMSIFVSAGDQASSGCERAQTAYHGIAVNGWASTPYNVAVGGTDFADTYDASVGGPPVSTYWNSTNTSSNGSAKSYIPEIPWNSTCGSQLNAIFSGYTTTYGTSGFCNNVSDSLYLEDWGGGGGPSACATGTPSVTDVVSGTCAGYAKPSWQSGVVGIPNDGVRDLPDVSLFASFGPWNHGYVICFSDTGNGGTTCDGTTSGWSYDWGGTSFASPIMAGVHALVNQRMGEKQGNPNYRLYQLAAGEYGASGSSTCNSSNGNTVGGSCIFYDVTQGDNDVPCVADSGTYYNCYRPSGTYGVLSTSNNSYQPAYSATTGWDFATGIGTVNVANLVENWNEDLRTATHDFNGDSKSDILWHDTSGDVAIWLMNGTSVLNPNTAGVGNVATTWSIVGTGDFNENGKWDILWRDTSGNIAIWEMNGTQVLNPNTAGVGNVSTVWSIVGTGDFNGDGKMDILWRDTSGNVAIWEMNGTTVLNPNTAGVGNVATTWSIVGTGDFNGDGKSDILWRDTSGNIAIWEMNGTQVLNPNTAGVGNVATTWSIVGTGDFNADGKRDILWHDTSGNVAIWEMNGTTVLNPNTAGVGNVPTTFKIVGSGDFNGDGHSDVLWRDTSGNIAIWEMNGTTVLNPNAAGVGNVPTVWTIQDALGG
jgi:hypothetical protein